MLKFSLEIFQNSQNISFVEHLRMATSVLNNENFKTNFIIFSAVFKLQVTRIIKSKNLCRPSRQN